MYSIVISLSHCAGPLLYHFADMPGEPSIELSWQDIRRIAAEEIGFEIIVRDRLILQNTMGPVLIVLLNDRVLRFQAGL